MKVHTYIIILLCGAFLAQCSQNDIETVLNENAKNDTSSPIDNEQQYNSYWYYSYTAEQLITNETLGLESKDFLPYTVANVGDTLFVANSANTKDLHILLIDLKTNKTIHTLRTWQVNGEEKTFDTDGTNKIDVILPIGNRLYVAEKQSRIHVFELPSLNYITCIGNGIYWSDVFEAQALIIKDGLIFARDKDSQISIYKESDLTPENYQKIKRYRKAAGKGASNNQFAPQNMLLNEDGNILVTDYAAKKIRVLEPSLVNDNMKNGESIDIENETLQTTFQPKVMILKEDRLYVTGGNDQLNIYDRKLKEWTKSFQNINGYTFSQPARIYAQNDSVFWVSDTHNTRRTLVKMGVYKNEIREYNRINKNIVKVSGAHPRNGKTTDFLVDLRTHEIID